MDKNPSAEHHIMANQIFDACVECVLGHVPTPSVKAETPARTEPKRIVAWPRKRAGKRIA